MRARHHAQLRQRRTSVAPCLALALVAAPLLVAAPASAREASVQGASSTDETLSADGSAGSDESARASASVSSTASARTTSANAAASTASAASSEDLPPGSDEPAPPTRRDDYSSQNAAVELRFGPYRPKVDDSAASPVYSEFFGDKSRFMLGVELDWQAWRAPYVGTLGIGVGWGYTQMSGTNLARDSGATGKISQSSTLDIMPFYAVGVLRIDTFARDFHVPLVPYGKFGFATALWWVNDGLGTATSDEGTKGKDVSTGIQAAIGGMFLLDILEPAAARAADVNTGVNNSYIFFEWAMSDYGGDQMNVGSNSWVTGFAFEM